MKKSLVLLTAVLLAAPFARAGQTYIAQTDYKHQERQEVAPPTPAEDLFRRGEWQFDAFGAYAFTGSENERVIGDHAWGGGIGVNYFFTRYFGLGVEGLLLNTDGNVTGSTAGNLIVRLPIESARVALYVYGGGGVVFNGSDLDADDFDDAADRVDDNNRSRDVEDVLFEGHIGLGFEYRISPRVGLFSDVRYTWVESDHSDYVLIRTGVRFVF